MEDDGAVGGYWGELGEFIEGAASLFWGPEGFGLIADAEQLANKGGEEPRGEGEVLGRVGIVCEGFLKQAVQGVASLEVAIEGGLHESGGDAGGIDEGGGLGEAKGVAAQQGIFSGGAGEQAECAHIFHGEVAGELLVQGGHGWDGGGLREDVGGVGQVKEEGGEEGRFIAKAFELGVKGLLEEAFNVRPDVLSFGELGVGLFEEGLDEGCCLAIGVSVLEFVLLLRGRQAPLLFGDTAEAVEGCLQEALDAEGQLAGAFLG